MGTEAKRRKYKQALIASAKALWGPDRKHRIARFKNPFSSTGSFDHHYWRRMSLTVGGREEPEVVLQLRGDNPAEAIKAIVARPTSWSMDCATFVQVVQLNALRLTLGDAEFTSYMNRHKALTGSILLRQHYSTGLIPKRAYETDETGNRWAYGPGRTRSREVLPLATRAARAPVGSEVTFSNPDLSSDDSYRFENAIKIGPDQYLAYPIGESPVVSGDAIRQTLSRRAPSNEKHPHKPKIDIIDVLEWGFFE